MAGRNSAQTSQNCDNFISNRSSTRLHAPPGGGSTMGNLLYGGGNDAVAQNPRGGRRRYDGNQGNSEHFNAVAKEDPSNRPERIQLNGPSYDLKNLNGGNASNGHASHPGQNESSNSYASGTSQNSGNYITNRSTTRVHNPPGGRSSISFG